MKKLFSLTMLLVTILVPHRAKAYDLPINLSNLYLSGNTSCNLLTNDKKRDTQVTFQPGFFVAPAIGYRFCNGFRIEGEFGYRHNCFKKLKFFETHFHINGPQETYTGMANFYYDFPLIYCFKPYIGAGLGYAHTKIKIHQGNISKKGVENGFAWQLISGLAFPVNNHADLALEYRFFQNERIGRIQNHDIGVTLRYYF